MGADFEARAVAAFVADAPKGKTKKSRRGGK